ncbi:ABC-2 transporter permease [Flindersiella endophytica]
MAARTQVPDGVRQLFRMWRLYAGMDLLWIARGVRDALLWILAGLLTRLAGITTTLLLAERFGGIGQWSKAQILFMLAYAMVVGSVLDMLFGYNLKMISRRIGRGQLDHMLVAPQPLWRQFVTEGFMPASQPWEVLVATGLMVWAGSLLSLAVTPGWMVVLLVNLLASAVIVLSLQIAWGSLAFWAPRAAEEINSSTNRMAAQLGNLPLDNVPRLLLGGLLTAVPVGFVAWLPSRAVVGVSPLFPGGLFAPLAAPLFLAAAVFVFRKGLQHYVRVGSGRYSSFGHRR